MRRIEEFAIKQQRMLDIIERYGLDAILLKRRANFAWLTCGGLNHVNTAADLGIASLLVMRDRCLLLTNNIEVQRLIQEQLHDLPIEVTVFPWHDTQMETSLLEELTQGLQLGADVPGYSQLLTTPLWEARASLTPAEVTRYLALGQLTSELIESVCHSVQPGDSEWEIAARMHHATMIHGARVPVCLVAADQRIALYRHPLPTSNTVKKQVMLAACVELEGLVCSATRIVHWGPLDQELKRRHQAVCHIDAIAKSGTRVGRPVDDIFDDIVIAYQDTGYSDQWQHHHQGGSIGYQPRDLIATAHSTATVQPDHAFAWNPTIAGTKSEDTIIATNKDCLAVSKPGENWPVVNITIESKVYQQADILVKD